MTSRSLICGFIKDHTDDWRELIASKNIIIKDDGRLSLFKYGINADFSDPIVCEARGIIIDHNTLDVVCWPFKKFFNIQESYAANINWNTAVVQDKIDGSLIKVWWDWNLNKWRVSTMSTIDASEAETSSGTNFYDLFCSAININQIRWYDMSKMNTYLFELVSPDNQIVIHYPVTRIWHIGTISNITGEDIICDIGIGHPAMYPLSTKDECMEAVKHLNDSGLNKEGFVVVDQDYNRIKIKSPKYLEMHRTINNHVLSPERYVEMIMTCDVDEICEIFPQHKRYIRYYQWQLAEFEREVETIVASAERLKEEFNGERKAIANYLIKLGGKYAHFGFKALDTGLKADELINNMTSNQIVKFLTRYKNEFAG